jgi:WD40 repeat protein
MDGSIRIWNLDKAQCTHEGGVSALVVRPDGRYAVSMGTTGGLKLWDLSARESRPAIGFIGAIQGCL